MLTQCEDRLCQLLYVIVSDVKSNEAESRCQFSHLRRCSNTDASTGIVVCIRTKFVTVISTFQYITGLVFAFISGL